LALAEQDYQRTVALFRDQAISRQQLDQARTALDTARAAVAGQLSLVGAERVLLRYYWVSAPFEGVVGDVPVRVGDLVSPATILTTIDQVKRIHVYINVPGENADKLHLQLPVRIVDATGAIVDSGEVDFVSPRVERDTQTVLVKATMPNEKGALRQAQSVRARVVYGASERLLVPVVAVSRLGGQSFIFVAEPSGGGLVARRRPIETRGISGSDYVVEKGLSLHEKIAVSNVQKLNDGTPLRPEG
jgi:RND family efflux transporter MFP subunit